jgi:hypothetical protein
MTRKGHFQGKREKSHNGMEELEKAVWDPKSTTPSNSQVLERAPFLKVLSRPAAFLLLLYAARFSPNVAEGTAQSMDLTLAPFLGLT